MVQAEGFTPFPGQFWVEINTLLGRKVTSSSFSRKTVPNRGLFNGLLLFGN